MDAKRLLNPVGGGGEAADQNLPLSAHGDAKALFENFLESAPIGIALLDLQFRFVLVNRCLADWTGVSLEDPALRPLQETWGGLVREWLPELNEVVRSGEPLLNQERRLEPPGKITRDVLASFHPVRDKHGNISNIGMFVNDITPRKQVEQALAESERKLRLITAATSEAIIAYDMQGDVVYANPAVERLTGYSNVELQKRRFINWIYPDDQARMLGFWEKLFKGEGFVGEEYRVLTKKGEVKWALSSWVPLYDESGHQIGVQGIERDITKRKELEQALVRSENRFRRLVEANVIGVLSGEGELITFANDSFLHMLGYTREDFNVRKLELSDVSSPECLDTEHNRWDGLLTKGVCPPFEKEFQHKDGSRVPALCGAALIDRASRSWVCFVLDLNDRKDAERRLRDMAEELARSNRDLQDFAYIASHDLKEPLRMVSSFVRLIAQRYHGKLDSDADDFIGYALDGARRMNRLIDDLLIYARVDRGQLKRERVSLNQILKRVMMDLGNLIDESTAKITFGDLPAVTGDEVQLGQLFQNLLTNAIKFKGDAAPIIDIRARNVGEEWIISVQDNGIGINKEFAERVFLPFRRVENHQTYRGTGMGLAICRKIVERHGGEIWVDSEPGEGSMFYFSLAGAESVGGI